MGLHFLSGCLTARCSCRKKGKKCTEGCECKHCGNLTANSEIDEVHVALEELVLHEDNNDADDDELGDWIFMETKHICIEADFFDYKFAVTHHSNNLYNA